MVTKKISKAMYESLKLDGFNIGINQFEAGNQIVPHLHIHITPRYKDDNFKLWPSREYRSEKERKEIQEKITKLLK